MCYKLYLHALSSLLLTVREVNYRLRHGVDWEKIIYLPKNIIIRIFCRKWKSVFHAVLLRILDGVFSKITQSKTESGLLSAYCQAACATEQKAEQIFINRRVSPRKLGISLKKALPTSSEGGLTQRPEICTSKHAMISY